MSVNKYNKDTGELVTLASGTRIWIGTKAAHAKAIANGTMPNNCMICVIDDFSQNNKDINLSGEFPNDYTVQYASASVRGDIIIVNLGFVIPTGATAEDFQINIPDYFLSNTCFAPMAMVGSSDTNTNPHLDAVGTSTGIQVRVWGCRTNNHGYRAQIVMPLRIGG